MLIRLRIGIIGECVWSFPNQHVLFADCIYSSYKAFQVHFVECFSILNYIFLLCTDFTQLLSFINSRSFTVSPSPLFFSLSFDLLLTGFLLHKFFTFLYLLFYLYALTNSAFIQFIIFKYFLYFFICLTYFFHCILQ